MQPGDALIIYTDGVSEARGSGGLYGEDAVERIIADLDTRADADAIAGHIEHSVLAYGGDVASDDIAIVVVRVPLPA